MAVGQEICRYNSRVTEKTYDAFVLALNKAEKEQADEVKEAESGFLVSKHVAFVATSHASFLCFPKPDLDHLYILYGSS